MTTLSLDFSRCQGRIGRSLGQACLVGECIDCLRRTDVPADVRLSWMEPPAKAYVWMDCPSKIEAQEHEEGTIE